MRVRRVNIVCQCSEVSQCCEVVRVKVCSRRRLDSVGVISGLCSIVKFEAGRGSVQVSVVLWNRGEVGHSSVL